MNCINVIDPNLANYLEMCNLYIQWNQAWFEFYLNFYQFYLPKQ